MSNSIPSTSSNSSIPTSLKPTLLTHLTQSLTSTFPNNHNFKIQLLKSQPRRSFALFPHSSNVKLKIWQEEILIILSEELNTSEVSSVNEVDTKNGASIEKGGANEQQRVGRGGGGNSNERSEYKELGGGRGGGGNSMQSNEVSSSSTTSKETLTNEVSKEEEKVEGTEGVEGIEGVEGVDALPKTAFLPIVALEANIYTIPSTSTSLIYISKVDTSGLLPSNSISPAKTLIASYINYNLINPPHDCHRLRIHIFAKSQSQYLFPGSIENEGKKVLDDKGLLRWWKSTLSLATNSSSFGQGSSSSGGSSGSNGSGSSGSESNGGKNQILDENLPIQQYYFIPGLTETESFPYVPPPPAPLPSTSTSSSPSPRPWIYSHAFSLTPSPLHLPSQCPPNFTPILTDLLPAFPDDPKSRFLHSLSSSSISCSGTKDDYDDLNLGLASNSFTVGYTSNTRLEEVERDRERERKRLVEGVEGGVEEWWERMSFRQECCSGVLVGFFALVRDELEPTLKQEQGAVGVVAVGGGGEGRKWELKSKIDKPLASLPNNLFIKLWSQFHNVDYSRKNLVNLIESTKKWELDLEKLILSEGWVGGEDVRVKTTGESEEGVEDALRLRERRKEIYKLEVKREFQVRNQSFESKKRNLVAVEEKKVNVMVPRKKKVKV